MKHPLSRTLWLLTGLFAVLSAAHASPQILDKSVRGTILPDRLSLELHAIACDTTQALIPDGSKLVSDRFALTVGDDNLGYFAGLVRIVTPDGRTIARGLMRGTAGLAGMAPETSACTAPGHLDGFVQAVPVLSTTADSREALTEATMQPPALLLHFEALRVPQSTEALFEGRLKGFFAPPAPPPPAVLVKPDRLQYQPTDAITALVANRSDQTIQAADDKTDCTILWLQKRVGDTWQNLPGCMLDRATRLIPIKPGESLTVVLPGAAPGQAGREPGAYRLALDFNLLDAAGQVVGDPLTVYSPVFTILGTPPPGNVIVAPERLLYPPNEPIHAIVANKSDQTIASLPVQSYCTIVLLERRAGDAWTKVGDCAYVQEPDPMIIPPATRQLVVLPPGAGEANHEPGDYRMTVFYQRLDAAGNPAGEMLKAVSPIFQVTGTPPPPPGVRINPGRDVYRTFEPIQASVTNLLPSPIAAIAFHSYCSLLELQRQTPDGWKTVGPCMLAGGPTITIPPGQTVPVVLPPDSNWPDRDPGAYRLVLTYTLLDAATGQTGEAQHAVSPVFQIVSGEPPALLKIAPDKLGYAATETITALLMNGAVPVSIMDGQTLCTIVKLQRMTDAGWITDRPCGPGYTPQATILQPNQSLKVPLTIDAAWTAGRYRLAVTYTALNADGSSVGAEQTVWSEPFPVGTVTPPPPRLAIGLNKSSYGTDEPIGVSLANGPARIRILDMKSFCTIIELQVLENNIWSPVAPCEMKRLPIPVYLEPGQQMNVVLPPDITTMAANWKPGMYRVVVTFAPVDAAGQEIGEDRVVTTAPFAIGVPPPPTGKVLLAPDRPSYPEAGSLYAVISNQTRQTIRGFTGEAFCTIVGLQRFDGAAWVPEGGCPLASMPHPVDIPAGTTMKVAVPPESLVPQQWKPGYYRFTLRFYFLGANGEPILPAVEIASEKFAVGMGTLVLVDPSQQPFPVHHLPY